MRESTDAPTRRYPRTDFTDLTDLTDFTDFADLTDLTGFTETSWQTPHFRQARARS